MSLKKSFSKDGEKCTVTFTVRKEVAADAKEVYLVGDFNGWDETSLKMRKNTKEGSFSMKKDLDTGKEYQFRYLICNGDSSRWENDWEADSYVPSGVANTDNSLVSTFKPEPKRTAKKPTSKKCCKK